MTPQFVGISVPGVDFSQPELQKHAIFTDFGSELWKNSAFQRKVCSLEVGVNFQDLHFTFTALVVPVGAGRDTR